MQGVWSTSGKCPRDRGCDRPLQAGPGSLIAPAIAAAVSMPMKVAVILIIEDAFRPLGRQRDRRYSP